MIEVKRVEIFSWIDPETGEDLHFDATAMRVHAVGGGAGVEKVVFPIEESHVALCLVDRAVDQEYASRMTAEKLDEPIIGVSMPDGTTLTVDGHHRLVRWHLDKQADGVMWLFWDEAVWRQFLLDLPDEIREQFRKEIEG